MKKHLTKLSVFVLFLVLSAFVFAMSICAAGGTVVYLADGGTGDGSSAAAPCGSYADAFAALDLTKDCTVVICGPFTQSAAFNYSAEYTGSVTYTSVYDGVDYRTGGAVFTANDKMYYVCRGETRFENINVHVVGGYYMYGCHYPITMGEGITVTGDDLTGETVAKSFTIYGGYRRDSNNPPKVDDRDTSVTLLSGTDYYVIPFQRYVVGTYMGTANIYIGGTAEVGTLQGSTGQDGSVVGDTKVTLTDNAVIRNFFGSTGNVTLNSFELTWLGGTMGDIFDWSCRFTPTKTLTITSGTKLIASEKAQRRSNFSTIAAMFDEVEAYAEPDSGSEPVTPAVTDGTVAFIRDGGMGNGYAANDAVGSFIDAFEALDLTKDCTIVVCGPTTLASTFNFEVPYAGSVTFTSVYDNVDYRKTASAKLTVADKVLYICCGATNFQNIDLHALGGFYIYGLHNPIVMGEGITVTGDKLTGDKVASSVTIYGGYRAGTNNPPLTGDDDVHITVLSGNNYYIVPFNRTIVGTYTGTAYIHIGGTASVGTLMGGAGTDGSSVGDAKITLTDSAEVLHFYGSTGNVTQSSIELTWISGHLSKIFDWTCRYTTGKLLTITNGTKLIASDTAKAHENYALISSLFDTVEDYTGSVEQKPTAPVKPDVKSDYGCARGLYTLGLAQGYDTTGTNFGLADKMTRVQTVVQVIRFLGVEDEVKAGTYQHPFTDVPAWANNYVGYAYTNKITSGMSATKFDPDGETTEAQFLTFMLRAIGYSDANGDFVWSDPFALAKSIGMRENDAAAATFLRGDAFRISWNTLYATAKNGSPVYDNLIAAGVFTASDLDKAASAALSAVEPVVAKPVVTPSVPADPEGYNVLSKADYYDKTLIGFLSDMVGVLTGYEHVTQNGAMRVALPESWYKGLLQGPFAEPNEYNTREDLLVFNEETQLWEVWTDDDYSIDLLNQYVIRDSYNTYGMITSKASSNARLVYNQYDMGGGHRNQGAYGLAKNMGYLAPFTGKAEFGNLYSTIGEPIIQCETLGMDAAGMPNVAVNLSAMFSDTTSDGSVNTWAKFMSALHALAYFETDVTEMLRKAQKMLPADSYEYYIVETAFALYEKYPTDWRQAVREADNMLTRYCYVNDITQNPSVTGAFKVLAVLYGQGGYEATEKILALAGYGGESSGASMLSVIGILQGWENLEPEAKAVINEKIWQDGKGVLVNLPSPDKTSSGYWMHAAGLPERILIKDIVDMYQANFEKILVENGGYIDGENYYIPKYRVYEPQSVFFAAFEDGLGDFTAVGNAALGTEYYTGKNAAQVNGGDAAENSVYKTVSGLTVGAQYRITAYVSATTNTTAQLFAREVGATDYAYMTVYSPARYAQRKFTFTATAETMEIGLAVTAGTSQFKYACLDDILVERVVETAVASAAIVAPASDDKYTGTVTVNIAGKYQNVGGGEAYLKVTFANTTGGTLNVPVTLNGAAYATVPFYATGSTAQANAADATYIPIPLSEDTSTVTLNVGTAGMYVRSVEVVTVKDRF